MKKFYLNDLKVRFEFKFLLDLLFQGYPIMPWMEPMWPVSNVPAWWLHQMSTMCSVKMWNKMAHTFSAPFIRAPVVKAQKFETY